MLTIAFWITLVYLLFTGVLVVRGPSLWDRLLGLNLITSKLVVLIVFFASMHDLAYLLDLAIIYLLFGFIATIFIALYLRKTEKGERK